MNSCVDAISADYRRRTEAEDVGAESRRSFMAQTTKALTPRSDSFHPTVRLVLAFPILPLTGRLFLP